MARAERQAQDRSGSARKDDVIQIRAMAGTKALLNRAAVMRGQTLTEFMLESARREAETALLDQRSFFLDAEAHEQFLAMLDAPAPPSEELIKLMRRKPAWEN